MYDFEPTYVHVKKLDCWSSLLLSTTILYIVEREQFLLQEKQTAVGLVQYMENVSSRTLRTLHVYVLSM